MYNPQAMKKEILPAYFSTLNKGKVTLYIRKEYEEKLSKQDINIFLDLYKNSNESNKVYHGRSPCKSLLMDSLENEVLVVRDYWHGGFFGKLERKDLSAGRTCTTSPIALRRTISIFSGFLIINKCPWLLLTDKS